MENLWNIYESMGNLWKIGIIFGEHDDSLTSGLTFRLDSSHTVCISLHTIYIYIYIIIHRYTLFSICYTCKILSLNIRVHSCSR